MTENLLFLKEYFTNVAATGAVLPDSTSLVKTLLKHAPLGSAQFIVEYGSASGTVTREIISRKRAKAILVCVEKNRHFFEALGRSGKWKNVHLVNEDVFRWVRTSAIKCGIHGGGVDCIISTLPCSSIDFESLLKKAVLPLLKSSGVFIQYMHTLSFLKGFRLRPILDKNFESICSEVVYSNLPPTLVYTCKGLKSSHS